jgi:hypothetical protein
VRQFVDGFDKVTVFYPQFNQLRGQLGGVGRL